MHQQNIEQLKTSQKSYKCVKIIFAPTGDLGYLVFISTRSSQLAHVGHARSSSHMSWVFVALTTKFHWNTN